MKQIVIERAGLQSLLVASPRAGHRHEAIAWCGAFDTRAFDDANAIVGNDPAAAAIEAAYGNICLRFTEQSTFAITGADLDAWLDEEPVAAYRQSLAKPGARLRLGSPRRGARSTIAVRGGIEVPAILGSRSTDIRAGFGGFCGRALRDGDTLTLGTLGTTNASVRERIAIDARLRVIRERMHLRDRDLFSLLCARTWRASPQSDRVGVRCEGSSIAHDGKDIQTLAVFPGTIQLPPNGTPIVLGVDAPTTGGYPVIAHVLEEDRWKIGQIRIGEEITFLPVWRIDLNADLGEGCGDDESILALVTSANIACGGHAGDERSMRDTIRAARRCGVSVGAHPSYPDREGFGRRPMEMRGESLAACVAEQIVLLAKIACEEGVALTHVKPHGALYNRSAVDDEVADVVADAVAAVDSTLALVGLAGSRSLDRARARGLRAVGELFADRRYRADGMLVPRNEPAAIIESPEEAAAQALDLARSGRGESICLHGDTQHALFHARRINEELRRAGFLLRSAASLDG